MLLFLRCVIFSGLLIFTGVYCVNICTKYADVVPQKVRELSEVLIINGVGLRRQLLFSNNYPRLMVGELIVYVQRFFLKTIRVIVDDMISELSDHL